MVSLVAAGAALGLLPAPPAVLTFDGVHGRDRTDEGFFRDRVEEVAAAPPPLRLVLLREPGEHPQLVRRAVSARQLAESRRTGVSELVAEGESPLERLASLVAQVDYATVYLALLLGIDPTPLAAIDELKEGMAK